MPRKDYIPDSARDLRDWAQNYLAELDAIATRLGWPTSQSDMLKAALTKIRDSAQQVLDLQNDLETATGQFTKAKAEQLPEIRQDTANLKTMRGFTDGDGRTLGIVTANGAAIDPATYQPSLTAETRRNGIEIIGKKYGADSLNLYMRRRGEPKWTLQAPKRKHFPYTDDTPPLTPGQPEEREYQAIGIVGDDEFGQPSDIVSAVFRP